MTIVRKAEVRVYIERLYCEECEKEMELAPFVTLTYPVIYNYRCPNGCSEFASRESFPRTVYEEVEE